MTASRTFLQNGHPSNSYSSIGADGRGYLCVSLVSLMYRPPTSPSVYVPGGHAPSTMDGVQPSHSAPETARVTNDPDAVSTFASSPSATPNFCGSGPRSVNASAASSEAEPAVAETTTGSVFVSAAGVSFVSVCCVASGASVPFMSAPVSTVRRARRSGASSEAAADVATARRRAGRAEALAATRRRPSTVGLETSEADMADARDGVSMRDSEWARTRRHVRRKR